MMSTTKVSKEEELAILWKEYNEWFAMQGYWDAEPTILNFAGWLKIHYTEK